MSALLSKVIPLLNKYVPAGVAIKGIEKINPNFKSFVTTALGVGYTAENIIDYLRETVETSGQTQERQRIASKESQGTLRPDEVKVAQKEKGFQTAKKLGSAAIGAGAAALTGGVPSAVVAGAPQVIEAATGAKPPPIPQEVLQQQSQQPSSLIQQLAPNLYTFLKEKIQQGRAPLEAGALARVMGQYNREISRVEKQSNMPFSNIIEREFGNAGQMETPQGNIQQPQTQPIQSQGISQADQALMAAIQNLQNTLR